MYCEPGAGDGLQEMLNIDKRREMIKSANKAFSDTAESDNEEQIEESLFKLTSAEFEKQKEKKAIKDQESSPKKRKKQTSNNSGMPKIGELEDANAKLLNDLTNLGNGTQFCHIKALSCGDLVMARAYLAFPPQMNFVPSDAEIEKLIKQATKYRYEKDIPKIFC
jgi:hypothetical protein